MVETPAQKTASLHREIRERGARWVRYRWLPEAGVASLSGKQAKARGREYLQEELRGRLAREPVRFVLEVQIAREGDRVDDPTAFCAVARAFTSFPGAGHHSHAGTLLHAGACLRQHD